jgi:hypothetical protein
LRVVGVRLRRLDLLTADLAELLAHHAPSAQARTDAAAAASRAQQTTDELCEGLDDEDIIGGTPTPVSRELQRLYRRCVRAMHPDLAVSEADRAMRTEYMANANAAYAARNSERLRELLEMWMCGSQAAIPSADDELAYLHRAIHAVKRRLMAVQDLLDELRKSELGMLLQRAQVAQANGRDLLREMADDVDRQIDDTARQLQALRSSHESDAPIR